MADRYRLAPGARAGLRAQAAAAAAATATAAARFLATRARLEELATGRPAKPAPVAGRRPPGLPGGRPVVRFLAGAGGRR